MVIDDGGVKVVVLRRWSGQADIVWGRRLRAGRIASSRGDRVVRHTLARGNGFEWSNGFSPGAVGGLKATARGAGRRWHQDLPFEKLSKRCSRCAT